MNSSTSTGLSQSRNEVPGPSDETRTGAGPSLASRHKVICLKMVVAKCITSRPEIDAEGPVNLLAPALHYCVTAGVESLRPLMHGQLVVAGLPLHLDKLQPVEQELLDDVLKAHERVGASPYVVSCEGAEIELLFGGRRVQVEQASGPKALPNSLEETAVVRNVLDDTVDNDGIVRCLRLMLQKSSW